MKYPHINSEDYTRLKKEGRIENIIRNGKPFMPRDVDTGVWYKVDDAVPVGKTLWIDTDYDLNQCEFGTNGVDDRGRTVHYMSHPYLGTKQFVDGSDKEPDSPTVKGRFLEWADRAAAKKAIKEALASE